MGFVINGIHFYEKFVCEYTPDFHLLNADFIPLASNWYLPKLLEVWKYWKFKDFEGQKWMKENFKDLKKDYKAQGFSRRVWILILLYLNAFQKSLR